MRTWVISIWLVAVLATSVGLADQPEPPALTPQEQTELAAKSRKLKKESLEAYRARQVQKAFELEQEAFPILRKLHGDEDHSDLAVSLNNMGYLLQELGQFERALKSYSDALAMCRRLYKDQDHHHLATSLGNMASALEDLGRLEEALPHCSDALAICRRLTKDNDDEGLAIRLNNMGALLNSMGRPKTALPFYRDALAMRQRLYHGQDHALLASSLSNMAGLLRAMGEYDKALPLLSDALEMFKRLCKGGDHPELASVMNNMGFLLVEVGQHDKALMVLTDALAMTRRLHKNQDHPALAVSLNNLGALLLAMGQMEKSLPYYTDALEMHRRLYKDQDHPHLAQYLNNMGHLFQDLGQHEKALKFFSDALAMRKRLSKDQDHPDVAQGLNNMGHLLKDLNQDEKALPYYSDTLAMLKRLHKDQDHPALATSLSNMGGLLGAMGQHEKALPFVSDALAMSKRLRKDQDHPELAIHLNNMGHLLKNLSQHEKALPFCTDALSMRQRLYKDQDHADLAIGLNNMGYQLLAMGQNEEALPFFQDALAMRKRLSDRLAYAGGLGDAVDYIRTFGDTRSAFLSVSQQVPASQRTAHERIWTTKASLGQVLRTRQGLVRRRQRSEDLDDVLDQLGGIQRRLSGIISQSVSREGDAERDRELHDLTEKQHGLERQIANLLPERMELAKLELTRLVGSLKATDVFVDLYRYYDVSAMKEQRTFYYVAFVATKHSGSVWVDLGPAKPIDETARAWIQALVAWSPKSPPPDRRDIQRQADQHAETLRRNLWGPIEKHLPADAERIYISPDGDLGRVPFVALPGHAPGTVLLDEYAIAFVDSGPFLLEHLTLARDRSNAAGTLLLAGGIRYDPIGVEKNDPWPFLEGSERERTQVLQLWGERAEPITRSGHEATTDWLLTSLPEARYAHLATHGEFKAAEFATERERLEKATHDRLGGIDRFRTGLGEGGELGISAGAGVRNPLGYVGVVMAGANQPTEDSPDRGIAAGTSIWPLDLSKMELAVLSACETGLGENTGGAGVQNLQLAFHVAGCENVVASLWKVDDNATAALMAKFYHELWQQGKPPIEALREAQLLVMRRPDLIEKLSGVRGRIEVEKAVKVQPGDPAPESSPTERLERLPAKYWAAFVLSGVGK